MVCIVLQMVILRDTATTLAGLTPFITSECTYIHPPDFINGWDTGVLQRAVDECNCNPYGDPTCCAAKQIFTIDQHTNCYITSTVDETSRTS